MPSLTEEEVQIGGLMNKPYIDILCYPKPDPVCASQRIKELGQLHIRAIVFEGRTKIGKLGVLGKGCVSIVVKAMNDTRTVALKIRRTDANRPSMRREAELHMVANTAGVGPKLYGVSENFIVMELVDGQWVTDWVKGLESIEALHHGLKSLLEQCYALDSVGLDHGELSDLKKHVIMTPKPIIIDFESASLARRPSNVTKVVQYLLIGGPVAKLVRDHLTIKDVALVISSIREYKKRRDRESYLKLLSTLGLNE